MSDPVERALESLRSVPSGSWHDPAVIGRRRRRRRFSMAAVATVVAGAGVGGGPRLGSSGGGSPVAGRSDLPSAIVRDGAHIGTAVQLVANVTPLRSSVPAAIT